jgi:DNA primase
MKKHSNARDYLKNRSLGKDEVKKFKIGYIEKNPKFF